MAILQRAAAALGSGVLLRQILRQHRQQTEELRQIRTQLGQLTRAVERLVPPPPDTSARRPADPQFADRTWIQREDDHLRALYDLQQQLEARDGQAWELEQVEEEQERRAAAAEEAEHLHRQAELLGGPR